MILIQHSDGEAELVGTQTYTNLDVNQDVWVTNATYWSVPAAGLSFWVGCLLCGLIVVINSDFVIRTNWSVNKKVCFLYKWVTAAVRWQRCRRIASHAASLTHTHTHTTPPPPPGACFLRFEELLCSLWKTVLWVFFPQHWLAGLCAPIIPSLIPAVYQLL